MKEEKGSLLESQRVSSSLPRLLFLIAPFLIIFLALCYFHIKAINLSEDVYTGLLPVLDRGFDLWLALTICAIAFCTGRAISRSVKLEFDNPAEEISLSVILGTGALGLAVFFLGIVGLLSPVPVILMLILFIAASFREASRVVSISVELYQAAIRNPLRIFLSLLFLALAVNMLLRAATPVHSFDEAIYHLSVAKRFADQNRIYPLPDNWAGNGPFLIQMIYIVCILAKADIAAKIFSLLLALLCAVSIYGFCRRLFSHQIGIIALFAFFAAGMVVEVGVTARTDVSLAFILFLATYAMIVFFETGKTGWLYASAMFAGLAMGVKYTAGIWILLLALLYLVESFIRKSSTILIILKRGLIYAAIAAVLASPWFIKNAIWFNNPVYPFVTGEVAEFSPQGSRFFNSLDDAKLEQTYEAARSVDPGLAEFRKKELEKSAAGRVERYPLKVWEYFTKPDIYNMAEEYHYPNYLFLLSPLLPIFFRRRWLIWLGLISIAFFFAVTSTSWVGRILLPVYPALTVISSFILSQSIDWVKRHNSSKIVNWIPMVLVIGVVAGAVGYPAYVNFAQARKERAFEFISGSITKRNFMFGQFYYPPLDFMNHQLPKDARVMMIGAQMSYDLEREYLADVNWDSTDWRRLLIRNRNFDELSLDLKRQGITHILFTDSLFKWVALMGRENYPNISGVRPQIGPDYRTQMRNWTTMDIFSRDYLETIYTDQMGYILYRVK